MKRSIIFTLIILCFIRSEGQNLLDIYMNKSVDLKVVSEYALENDWEEIFFKPDFSSITHLGLHYQIAVTPDGSVIMSNKYYPDIIKFAPNGNYIENFEVDIRISSNSSIPKVEGIFNDKYFFTNNGYDGIQFFDFDGNHIKTLSVSFMPVRCTPLEKNKIAILGYLPLKNRQTKRIIIVKDYNTGEETTIWSQIFKNKRGEIEIKLKNGSLMNLSVPGYYPIPRMATSKKGDLVVAFPDSGNVVIYSPEGEVKNRFSLNIEAAKIGQNDIDEYYNVGKSNIKRFKERLVSEGNFDELQIEDIVTQYTIQIEKLKDQKFYPDHLPYFTSILVDSEGNLLVFEYTDEKNTNKFSVYTYSTNGERLCTSNFISKDYILNFAPHSFVFHKDCIYNIAEKVEGDGNPIRLVKFKVNR